MAEGLIRDRLEREGLQADVSVTSCGTWAEDGVSPTDHAVTVMSERNIDISALRSQEVTAEMVTRADLILVMTESHLIGVTTDFPDAIGKTRLVSSLAGGSYDIADPVGGSVEDYRSTADELERLLASGWSEVVAS
jgi:protein-tyrosine phosphatase